VILVFSGAAVSHGVTMNYTHRVAYYTNTFTSGTAGLYDSGNTNELGLYAHNSGGQSVGWRTFRQTNGTAGSVRELQVGDRFMITMFTYSPSGSVGCALLDGPSQVTTWNDRTNGARAFIQAANNGDLYVTYTNNATASWGGVKPESQAGGQTFVFDILSGSEITVSLTNQTPKYDLYMLNSPSATQRIDRFSIYLNWDHQGCCDNDAMWHPLTSVENRGFVEFGIDNGTRTIWGQVSDGLAADSTSTISTNNLLKKGTGVVTLGYTNNTYTGYTEIQGGVLKVSGDGCLGAPPSIWKTGHINIWSSGNIQFTETCTIHTNRGWFFGNVNGPTVTVDSAKSVTFTGVVEGAAEWYKAGAGTLFFGGNSSTNTGKVSIQAGTLRIGATGSLGRITGAGPRVNIWSTGTLEFTNTFTLTSDATLEIGDVDGPIIAVQDGSTITWAGMLSGHSAWSKQGPGTFVISGTQTNTGALVISNGAIRAAHANALGTATTGTTVKSGAALELSGGITTAAEPLNMSGTGLSSGGALRNISGNNTFAGAVTLGAASRINSDSGTLTLNSGTTMGGSGNALTIGGVGAVTISSVIGTGAGTLTKDGTGTGTVSGVNTYSGTTTLSGGKLIATTSASALGSGSLTLNTASTMLELDNDSALNFGRNTTVSASMTIRSGRLASGAGVNHTLGTLAIGANTLNVGVGTNVASGTAGLTFGAVTMSGASIFDVDSGALLTLSSTVDNGGNLMTVQGAGDTTNSGVISGSGGLTKAGAGTLTLSAANTYGGNSTISAGTLKLGAAGVIPDGASKGNVSVTGTLNLNTFSETINGLSGAGTVDTVAGGTPTLTLGGNDQSASFSGVIQTSAGTLAVTKTGTGTQTLSGANGYAGVTTIGNGGAIRASHANALGTTAGNTTVSSGGALELTTTLGAEPLTLNGTGIGSGGALRNISGNNDSGGGAITLGSASRINSDSGILTLGAAADISGAGLGLTIGGVGSVAIWGDMPTGAATFTKDGTGTNLLYNFSGTAVRTWTGASTISAGLVQLQNANGLSDSSALTISGGATFDMNGNNETVGSIAGAGSIIGAGTLTAGGDNSSTTYSGVMSGAGALTKTGSGTLTLSGVSTHSGATTVSAGSLIQNGTNTSSAVTVSSGATNMGLGTVGSLTVSGQIAPGGSAAGIGRFDVTTSLQLNNGSSFRCQLGNFNDAADRDYINNGDATPTFNATATVYVDSSALSNWNSAKGTNWNIIVGNVSSTTGLTLDQTTYWTEGTYPKNGGTFSLSASGGNLVLTFTPSAGPDIVVLGTNSAVIVTNDVTPSTADGTDFGYVKVSGFTKDNTFTITNSGATSLWIGAVAIGGTHASDFTVSAQPNVNSNLLSNGDFALSGSGAQFGSATINGWTTWGNSGWYQDDIGGNYSVKTWWDDSGIYQDFACTPGLRYDFSVLARHRSAPDPLVAWHGYLKAEFYDAGWTSLGSQVLGYITATSATDAWIPLSGSYTAPVSSANGRLVLGVDTWGSGASGAAYFDDASVVGRNINKDSQTTFRVTFDPSAGGVRSATVYITNNVSGKSPYQFDIQGYGLDFVDPTGARPWVDGNEMIRLDWTNAPGFGVIVVHKRTNAPTALTQGVAYNVGDAVGSDGGTVVAKKWTDSWTEHIVPAGSTNFYTFYTYTNNVYSDGVTVSTSTAAYIGWDIVDALCYTNAVLLTNNLNGGQGWSAGWNAWTGFTIVTNDTPGRPQLLNVTGYPERGGNRIKLAAPGGSNTMEAYRSFPTITTGMVFLAARISFANTGTNRWCGITAVSGTTHKVFFGETWGANGLLGMADYGGGQTATNVMLGWTNALTNTYLIIAQIDLESRSIGVVSYPGWGSVPAGRPVMSVYDTLAANYMNGIDGIGLKAGSDNLACDIGECYFDEIRVTHSWNELLHGTTPAITNYLIGNATNYVYDGQITSGVYTVSATAEDPYGIGANFDFFIYNPSGVRIVTNEHVDVQTWTNNGRTSTGTDTNRAGYYPGTLGVYTSYWSTVNSNGFWLYDCGGMSNGTVMKFTVADDDTNAPVHSGFTGHGRTLSGATYTNSEISGGLVITGLVTDAGSGLYGGTSNLYVLTRNGTQVDSGSLTALFANGSAISSNGQLRTTFPTSIVQALGVYTMQVFSVDYENDRPGDSMSTTSFFVFTVAPAPYYYADITFCGYPRAAPLTNFPLLVVLTNISGFAYSQVLNTNAADLRFYDAQTNELNYELEDWNSNGSPYAWVQVPTFSSNGMIRARWGNTALSTLPAYRTNGATWAQDFRGVYHLGANELDSTTNRNHGTNFNGSTDTAGAVGQGQQFDGDNDYIELPNNASLQDIQENNFTMSAWFNPSSVPPGSDPNYNMAYAFLAKEGYHECLYYGNDESLIFNHWLTGDVGAWIGNDPFPTGVAYHVVGVLDRTNGVINIYINGEFVDSASGAPGTATREFGTNPWRIGTGDDNTHNNYAFPAHGMIDEVRLESINRSSNWIWAAYLCQASNAAFLCYSRAAGVELEVLGTNGAIIVDGDTTPKGADGTDFGLVNTKTNLTRTFTITNLSTATQGIGPVTTNAAGNPGDFVIVSQPSATLAAGATTTIGVKFAPTAAGIRYADIQFTNTAVGGTYNFRVQGTGEYTATEFICDIKPSGGDYTSVASWHSAVQCNLISAGTRVYTGTVSGAIADGATVVLYRSGVSQGVTGTVTHATASQVLVKNITNTGFSILAGDVWRVDASNYFTLSALGDSAIAVARIGGTWTNASLSGFLIDGFRDTSSTNYVKIYTTPEARHDGKWNHSAYRVDATNTQQGLIKIENDYVELDGIQVHQVTDATFGQVYTVWSTGRCTVLKNMIVWGEDTYGNSFHGVSKSGINSPALTIYNSIVYGDYDWGIEALHESTDLYAYNCTVFVPIALGAFAQRHGDIYAYNCYAYAPGTSNCYYDQDVGAAGDFHLYRSASADGTGSPGLTNIVPSMTNGAYFVSTNAGSQDFHIKVSSVFISAGTNLTSLYTNDIDGDVRSSPWDIGADEFSSISVLGTNNALITDGDLWPTTSDGTDYGYVGSTITNTRTFFITNSSPSTVTVSAVTTSGTQAAEFVVVSWPGTVSPGGVSNLTIRFAPAAVGLRTAVVAVINSDTSRSNYDFGIQGTGLAPNPTTVSATADGNEMVRLAWTTNGSYGTVLILHKSTNAISVSPTQGTAYAVGDVIDGARVIFKGTGSNREHIVASGSTNFYTFYSVNGNYYSDGATANVTMIPYAVGAIVEAFAYTNGNTISSSRNGGQGFTNAWTAASGTYNVLTDRFTTVSGYPLMGGNSISGNTASINRDFAAVTSGKIYVGFMMRVDGGGGYAGLSFFDNGTEQIFFGEGGFAANTLAVDGGSGNRTDSSPSTHQLANNTDYTVIGMYDFDNNIAKAVIYTNSSQSVPGSEPGTWHVELSDADPTRINRIRLEGSVGIKWDEIRIATNWSDLLRQTIPSAVSTSFVVNAGASVGDGQVVSGTYAVAMHFYDDAGIESTNTSGSFYKPNFDIWNSSGTQILTNEIFSSFTYSGDFLAASDASHAGAAAADVTLGTYTSRWSAISSNGVSVTDSSTLSNGTVMTFTVYDDDTNAPLVGYTTEAGSVADGDFESNAFNPWYQFDGNGGGASFQTWAKRNGTYGMAWQSWAEDAYGGFFQNIAVAPSNGNIFSFSIYGYAENNFTSKTSEAWIKFEVRTNGSTAAIVIASNSVYGALTSNRNTWIQFTLGVTNTIPNITNISPIVGFGNIQNMADPRTVFWDDATFTRGSALHVLIGTTNFTSASSVFTMTDAQAAQVSNNSPLKLVFGAYDVDSGLSRGNENSSTQMNVDVGSWLTDNVTNYVATNSSSQAATLGITATSTWLFQSVDINALIFQTNAIQASLKDADADRSGDQLTLTNEVYGYLVVNDDDEDPPQVGWGYETNILVNASFELGDGTTTISNWNRSAGNTEHREGRWSSGYLSDTALPEGTNILKVFGTAAELVQTNITVVPGAFYHAYAQFYHSSTNDAICQTCGADSLGVFFKVIFYNSSQVPIATNYSGEHNASVPSNIWQYINLYMTAPTNATTATFHIQTSGGTNNAGALYADDFHLTRDARVMSVWVGTNNLSALNDGGTNAIHTLYDSYYVGVATTNKLRLVFGGYDTNSGLAQSSMQLDWENWLTDNTTNFVATNSSSAAETAGQAATSVWIFTATDFASAFNKTNKISLTLYDNDADRANDRCGVTNQQYGYIAVLDDDVDAPEVTGFVVTGSAGVGTVSVSQVQSGGWSITGLVRDVFSGINVNGATTSDAASNISPYFVIYNSTGAAIFAAQIFTNRPADGGATGWTRLAMETVTNTVAVGSIPSGVYTARVTVADNDEDRTNATERAVLTSYDACTFMVPGTPGLGVTPTTLNLTSYYGSAASGTFTVSNIGSGSLIYSMTNSYTGVGGWLGVFASNGTLATAGAQIHTASVDVAGLDSCTYQATITVNGNQTNSAQVVTVNLVVIGFGNNETVESFTNSLGLVNATTGGNGWTNAWLDSPANSVTTTATSLSVPANYPSAAGGKVSLETGNDGASEKTALRQFAGITAGKIFIAASLRKTRNDNTAGYFGLSMMDGTTEKAFFGKRFNEEFFGTEAPGAGYGCSSTFGIYQPSTYWVVGTYDFDSDIIKGAVYNGGDTLPLTEAGVNWRCSNSLSATPITRVDGFRIGGKDVETADFDELRVAVTWEDLLGISSSEPTVNASLMTFSNVATGQMSVSWNSGNGVRRMVVAREGSAVTFSPTDNVQYVANTNFSAASSYSGNKIVYDGSDSGFTLVGLGAGTNYHLKVFEYNSCGATLDYLTNGTVLASNRWTLVPEIANQPTSFAAWQKSSTEISNTWTASAGSPAPAAYLIVYGTNVPSTEPSDGVAYTNGQLIGNGVVGATASPGTATTALNSGLTPCLTYYFRIYPFATNTGGAQTYNYLTTGAPTSTAATACTDPTLQASNITFSAVDTNKMTVSWLNGSGEYRMLVGHASNAVDSMPVDQTAYTASAVFGSGTQIGTANYVIYSGTGATVVVSNLLPGVTYHFRVFEFNGSGNAANYITNTAVGNPASRATAAFGLAYDEFDDFGGTGQLTPDKDNGGSGWTNEWSQNFDVQVNAGGNMPPFKCYPRGASSEIVSMSNDGNTHDMRRGFGKRTSGRIYAAYIMNIASGGANTFAGLSFFNGNVETGYFGKVYASSSNVLGVVQGANEVRANYVFGTGSGNDYLIVGMYDFETHTLYAKAYTTNYFAFVDPTAVDQWDAKMTNVVIDAIDSVRLAKQNTGLTYFDEVRVGSTWEQVMITSGVDPNSGPTATLIYIGPDYSGGAIGGPVVTNLTDSDLANTNSFDFVVRWDDPDGIFLTNSTASVRNIDAANGNVMPNWDPLAPGAATNTYGGDNYFTNFYGRNGATSVTTVQHDAFIVTNVDLSQPYFVTVSAQDAPTCAGCTHVAPTGDDVACSRAITVNTALRFYTTDDDQEPPVLGTNLLSILQGGSLADYQNYGGTSTLRRYFLTDGSLAAAGFSAILNVYDASSGLRRATGGPETNLNVTIDKFVTNEVGSFSVANSLADTRIATSTSTWAFASTNFTYDRIGAMYGSGSEDLEIRADAADADGDRTNDISWSSNLVFGYLRIQDDDVGKPVLSNIGYAGSSTSNRAFWVSTNGTLGSSAQVSGTDTNAQWTIYDGDLANTNSGYLKFAFGAADVDSGVGRGTTGDTNTVMNVSVGDIIQGNYTNFSAADSSADAAGVPLTNVWAFAGAFGDTVITGLMGIASNEVTVTIPDSDNDRTNDQQTLTGTRVGWLKVLDDDTNVPTVGANPLVVMVGGAAAPVWTNAGTTNVVLQVSDGAFYSASGANPLAFSFNVSDTSSISRNTVGASSNMNVTVQNLTTNNTANYAASKSSASATAANATSVWEWTSGGDQVLVSNLFGPGTIGLTNVVQATIRDDDNDWTGDNLTLATQQFGYVWLYDDDTNAPVRANLLGENLLTNSGFENVGWWSGVADDWDGTNFPNDELGAVFGNHFRSDFRSHGGSYAVSIPGQWGNNGFDYGGLYQEATNGYGDGTVWKASAWAICDNGWTANYSAVSIEFYEADHATRVGAVTNIFGMPSNAWLYVSVTGAAPAGTVWSRIVLTASAMGTNGSLYFDDAVLQVATNAVLPMDVLIGGVSYYREGAGTNGIFQLTDDDLTGVTPTSTLKFVFRVYDPTSGVERSRTEEFMNYDLGNSGAAPLLNIYSTYSNDLSSSDTTVPSATSVFAHVANFSVGGIQDVTNFVETGEVSRLISAAVNPVNVSYPNGDQDRGAVDREWVIDSQFGSLVVQDEDAVGPVATLKYIGTNYAPGAITTNEMTDADLIQGGLDFAYEWVDANGLFITNNSGYLTNDGRYGNVNMNWELVDSNGVQYGADTIHPSTSLFSLAGNGSMYATAVQYNVSLFTYTNTSLGTWHIQASAQDMDNDRGMVSYNNMTVNLDRATRSDMQMTFTVRDDDSNYPSANNLAINGRSATNVIYDGELSTGFELRVRFWDNAAGVYTGAAVGAFSSPSFDIYNPSNQLVQTNQLFSSLSADTQLVMDNGGFETVGTNASQGLANSWDAICYTPPSVWFRSNGVGRSGAYALAADYTGPTNAFGEVMHQWIDVSNIAVGETFVLGGWAKVSNSIAGNGRTLLKMEWWDTKTTNGCPLGTMLQADIGSWIQNTANSWSNYTVTGIKPAANAVWLKAIVEVTFVDAILTNQHVYWDDLYVGSPSNVLAVRTGVTVPYSNIFLGDYSFQWTAQDSDNDRTNDTLGLIDATNMGYGPHVFNVQDDNPGSPTGIELWVNGIDKDATNVTDQQIRNGQWYFEMRIIDSSGVATSGVGDEWVPNYSLVNVAGTTVQQNYAWTSLTPADSATNLIASRTMSGVGYADVDLGWYSVLFSAQNTDNDRPDDRGAKTNFAGIGDGGTNGNQFWVRDDDTNMPSAPSTVTVDVVSWTNVNLFNVTFNTATDDLSGIFEYRYDTNVTPSASATNGLVVSGVATTQLSPVTSNMNFETGENGTVIPAYSQTTNGWMHFSQDNTTAQFWSAESQSGTQSIRHVIVAGENGGGVQRYTLVAQQVDIGNTNGFPVRASMSASFKGDLSAAGAGGLKGAAFLKMEFFDANTALLQAVDNEYGNDHNGQPLYAVNTGSSWSNVTITATNGPANARYMRFMMGVAQHESELPYTGYWDNVSITVKVIGAVGAAYSFPMTNALEGIRTNWLFAVDDDDDRPNDRLKSGNTNFITMLDLTPPPRATGITITNGLDEATEMQLNWAAVANAGNRAGDNEPLSPWRTYYIFYEECTNCDVTTNSTYVKCFTNGLSNLRTNTTTQAIISNLNFDSTYRFVIAGQDRVGNLATLSDTVTLSTLNFIVTQGIVAAASRVDISWMSSSNKTYDMLWVDGAGYSDSYSNYWTNLMGTVTNSWISDTGSATRLPPNEYTNGLRFFRVSREGQWQTNSFPRRASKEIYVSKSYVLRPGENWVSLPMSPDTNLTTMADIFGTTRLPAGSVIANATKASWYGNTVGVATNTSGAATNVLWLSSSGHWLWSIPAAKSGQNADGWLVPSNEAFNIEIPGTATQKLVIVGRLPTNGMTRTIYGATGQTNYNVLCYALPSQVAISNLGLKGAGFVGGANVQRSDEIRILDNSAGMGSLSSPKRRIWMNNSTNFVFAPPYSGSAESYIVEPGEALIIVRKRGPSITFTNRMLYSVPGKNVNP